MVMSGVRACPTYSARDRSMHHLFWNGSSRRIHTSTYGNLLNLKFSWNWFQQKHPSPLPIPNRIRNVSANGIIEAHMHRKLELVRCWIEKIIAIAGTPNAQEIIGWNAECLILMSIVLCYIHFTGKSAVIWWFTLKSWTSEVINSTGKIDSEEYE